MKPTRRALSVLALSVALPLVAPLVGGGTAEAGNIVIGSKTKKEANGKYYRVSATVAEGTSGDIASVTIDVASDAGRETVKPTETDAWLHGTAPLAALPSTDAELSLTLYDTASASLIAYSGRLGADGSVTLAEDAPACDPTSRLGCTVTEAPDIELLAAEVFASGRGYEVAVDLAGSAAHDVAYAAIVVTEWGTPDECLAGSRDTLCGGTDHLRTTAEVGWDTIGTVWEAALALGHDGPVDVKVKVRADEGPTEVVHASLGLPWLDGGEGVSTLAADADPLTTLGVMEHDGGPVIAVVSDGWTLATAPTRADVRLTTGETIAIPANSYQRRGDRYFSLASGVAIWEAPARLRIDGGTMTIDRGDLTFADLVSPLCAEGTCVTLVADESGVGLFVTQYRWDTAFATDEVHVSLTAPGADGAEEVLAEGVVSFGNEVSVVFANEVRFGGDPLRAALAGRVDLLGGDATLASGRFFGRVDRHAAGGLGLAGVGVDEIAAADTSFALLLQGERSTCGDDEDGFTAPPPLMATFGNGSGTKPASSQTSAKPQLL